MNAEHARLVRLQRLERIRAIAKQVAAAEAAQAESTLAQLQSLAARTRDLAAGYGTRSGAMDADALQRLTQFAGGLQNIAASTSGDADKARVVADSKFAALGLAERRRAAAEDRAEAQARCIAKGPDRPSIGGRKPVGTSLE
jgi:hypothetical protein